MVENSVRPQPRIATLPMEEHCALKRQMDTVRGYLTQKMAPDDPLWGTEMARILSRLSIRLHKHFVAEESSALFVTFPEGLPQLAPKIKKLEDEHGALSRDITGLIRDAERIRDGRGIERLTHSIEAFLARLNQHEAAEREIIQAAFEAGIV